ncbi:hypothetical protein [Flavobacterium sandaracinum]|uniref:hypothetical protein n=1 Tax=Flavobacterium sandaracinum TaxID=2541733 RepID=UPI001404B56D|nr:hypothetical protein [Flavobacterium sandaracinum]
MNSILPIVTLAWLLVGEAMNSKTAAISKPKRIETEAYFCYSKSQLGIKHY